MSATHPVIAEIERLFADKGGAHYGEGVSQTEHALQAALCAERDGAPPALIAAALLHDIGYLLEDVPEDVAEHGIDTHHESVASAWLSQHFGPEVTEPVRLHVAAKRYLCAADPGYLERLSAASALTLKLQGGPLDAAEAAAFAAGPRAVEAAAMRRWDDAAKVAGLATPGLAHFRRYVEAVLRDPERRDDWR